jgi:hypothetical protein
MMHGTTLTGSPPPTDILQENVAATFAAELQSFFLLCLLSLVFGSLAMAFGLQFILSALLAMGQTGDYGILLFFRALAGWAAAVIGFRWILSSAKVLKGVNRIRRDFRALGRPVSGETVTGFIARMMAHYREHWKTIWRMNLIATLGGCIFLALGIVNLVQGLSAGYPAPGPDSAYLFPFVAAATNIAIGLVSLLSSAWFRQYARAWELRLIEATQGEEALEKSMEQGGS